MATRIRPEPSRSASAPITRKRTTAVSSGRSLPITSTPAHFHSSERSVDCSSPFACRGRVRRESPRARRRYKTGDASQNDQSRNRADGRGGNDAALRAVNTVRRTIHAAMRTVKSGVYTRRSRRETASTAGVLIVGLRRSVLRSPRQFDCSTPSGSSAFAKHVLLQDPNTDRHTYIFGTAGPRC